VRCESSRKTQKNKSSPGHYNWYVPIPGTCPEKRTPCCPRKKKRTNGYRDTRDSRVSSTFKTQNHNFVARNRHAQSQIKRRTQVVLRRHCRRRSSSCATCRLWPSPRQRDWRFRAPSSSSKLARGCRLWSLRQRRHRVWTGLPQIESERCPETWTWQAVFACEVGHGAGASSRSLELGERWMHVALGHRLR
jgi:hypothetical protein